VTSIFAAVILVGMQSYPSLQENGNMLEIANLLIQVRKIKRIRQECVPYIYAAHPSPWIIKRIQDTMYKQQHEQDN
jgi:hypothetical protein